MKQIKKAVDPLAGDPDYDCHDLEGGGYACSYVGNSSSSAGW